ncbi:MAG: serine hydrolase, partial [Phycisphaerae bacterium]
DDQSIASFMEERIAPGLRAERSDAELRRQLIRIRSELADAAMEGARALGPFEAQLIFKPQRPGSRATLTFRLEDQPPHRYVEINFEPSEQGSAGSVTDAEMATRLGKFMDKAAKQDRFSGAVLVARDGKPLFQKAYGLASKRFNVPNRIDTKFNLGSMNKMFTGVAICQLAEQGKLSFDDFVITHLPDYPNREIAEKVTIHQLLTHTSGLGSYWNERFEATWTGLRTVEDLLPLFADEPLGFEPGSQFGYSNAGPVVLGLIIERISGQSYYDYVREHVFKPAGMTDTDSYEMDRPVPNLAIGYTNLGPDHAREDGPRRNNLFMHTIKGGPAGGGFSTVGDMLKFSLALQGHRLLGPKYTDILLTGKTAMAPGMKYAYLFGDHVSNGHRSCGHNGGAPGISAEFRFYPKLGYTLVALSNYDRGASMAAAYIGDLIETRPPTEPASEESVAGRRPPYRIGVGLAVQDGAEGLGVGFLEPDGPGEKAGLQADDVLLSVNGISLGTTPLETLNELLEKPGTLTFQVRRGDETMEINVTPKRRRK